MPRTDIINKVQTKSNLKFKQLEMRENKCPQPSS